MLLVDNFLGVGVVKYYDGIGKERFLLKIVSWGKTYYVNYNEYAQNLSFSTNIISYEI